MDTSRNEIHALIDLHYPIHSTGTEPTIGAHWYPNYPVVLYSHEGLSCNVSTRESKALHYQNMALHQ